MKSPSYLPLSVFFFGSAISTSVASIAWAPLDNGDGSWDLYCPGNTASITSFQAVNSPATGQDQLTIDGAAYRPVTMGISSDQCIEILDTGGATGTYDRFLAVRNQDALAAGESLTICYEFSEILRRPRSTFHRPGWFPDELPKDAMVSMQADYGFNGGGGGALNLLGSDTAGYYTESDIYYPSVYDTQMYSGGGTTYTITPSMVAGEDYALTYTYENPSLAVANYIDPTDPFPTNPISGAPDWGITKYAYTIKAGPSGLAAGTAFGFTVDGTLIPTEQLIAAPIPEPSRILLGLLGFGLLALRRRR